MDHFKILTSPAFAEDLGCASDPYSYAKAIQTGKYHYATADNYVPAITPVIKEVEQIVKQYNL